LNTPLVTPVKEVNDPMTTAAAPPGLRKFVETHHIDVIPEQARHGRPWHQFAFWFGGNVNIFNVVLGAVVVTVGLPFWWAIIAIVCGTMTGALLIALHATQGPVLGVPQTLQSRAQFGFYGATLFFAAVLALNLGFIASELVIQAQAMSGVTSALTMPEWIAVLAVPSAVIGVAGYRAIHKVMQATAVLVGVALVIMLIQGIRYGALPARQAALARPPAGLFAAGVALLVIDMLSFGPFVSDYSRYLPSRTNGRRLFWAIWSGNVLATIISCSLGAYLAALLPALAPVAAIGKVSGTWALPVMALSLLDANAFNAYTGSFQILALAGMRWELKPASRAARIVPLLAVMTAGTLIAMAGYQNFVTNLINFLDVVLTVFIPWSAINLADYFLIRRASYHLPSLFTPYGQYGRWAWRGIIAYLTGMAAQVPFISQPDYTGPLVKHLGGADISWIIGWVVAGAVYLFLHPRARRTPARHQPAAPAWPVGTPAPGS
jgi:NCS1 family nucleobase:cation symporter-1